MIEFLKKKGEQIKLKQVAKKQLTENLDALKSLRDYDEGKKDISTSTLERSLPGVRVAPKE